MRSRSFVLSSLVLALSMPATVSHVLASDADSVTFARRSAQVGDQAMQDMRIRLELEVTGGQASAGAAVMMEVENVQRRMVKILVLDQGRVKRVAVKYDVSHSTRGQKGAEPERRRNPVHGKSYFVSRVGNRLEITDLKGGAPSPEEVAFISRNLETLGKANPLAKFLDGKTITKGETVDLPAEAARELFGLQEALGSDVGLRLKLEDVLLLDGRRKAVFDAALMFKLADTQPIGVRVLGQLWVDPDSCRPVAAHLVGPISLASPSSEEGPPARSVGTIRVAMRSEHADADGSLAKSNGSSQADSRR